MKGFAVSVPGNGHIRREIPCQDASGLWFSPRPIAIVCDGRGSALLSHLGSRAAVKAFRSQCAVLDDMLKQCLDNEQVNIDVWQQFCQLMIRTLVQQKSELAEEYNVSEKEFDFTICFAVVGSQRIGFFQIGDGTITMRQNGEHCLVFEPDKGEFDNQTSFLRAGDDIRKKYKEKLVETQGVTGLILTSDGPEFLMYDKQEMTPGPIFERLFVDIESDKLMRQDILDYLTGSRWANDPRGADDRSLVILHIDFNQDKENREEGSVEEPVFQDEQHMSESVESEELNSNNKTSEITEEIGNTMDEVQGDTNMDNHKTIDLELAKKEFEKLMSDGRKEFEEILQELRQATQKMEDVLNKHDTTSTSNETDETEDDGFDDEFDEDFNDDEDFEDASDESKEEDEDDGFDDEPQDNEDEELKRIDEDYEKMMNDVDEFVKKIDELLKDCGLDENFDEESKEASNEGADDSDEDSNEDVDATESEGDLNLGSMFNDGGEVVDEMAQKLRLPEDYPPPREILREHFPKYAHHHFFKGGWGYDEAHATQIFEVDEELCPGEILDGLSVEELFINLRLREELLQAGDEYVLMDNETLHQSLRFIDGKPHDILVVRAEIIKETDLEALRKDWEEHNAYEDDPEGLKKHDQWHDSLVVTYKETFYFDISSFF